MRTAYTDRTPEGVLEVQNISLALAHKPGKMLQESMEATLIAIFVTGAVLAPIESSRRCWKMPHGAPIPAEAFGPPEDMATMGGC